MDHGDDDGDTWWPRLVELVERTVIAYLAVRDLYSRRYLARRDSKLIKYVRRSIEDARSWAERGALKRISAVIVLEADDRGEEQVWESLDLYVGRNESRCHMESRLSEDAIRRAIDACVAHIEAVPRRQNVPSDAQRHDNEDVRFEMRFEIDAWHLPSAVSYDPTRHVVLGSSHELRAVEDRGEVDDIELVDAFPPPLSLPLRKTTAPTSSVSMLGDVALSQAGLTCLVTLRQRVPTRSARDSPQSRRGGTESQPS